MHVDWAERAWKACGGCHWVALFFPSWALNIVISKWVGRLSGVQRLTSQGIDFGSQRTTYQIPVVYDIKGSPARRLPSQLRQLQWPIWEARREASISHLSMEDWAALTFGNTICWMLKNVEAHVPHRNSLKRKHETLHWPTLTHSSAEAEVGTVHTESNRPGYKW